MRDDVLIVLNEREPLKRQRAADLEQQLTERARSVARLSPQEHLGKLVRERNPKVLLADYLLGDYGTILEVLQELADTDVSTILWTDEPSLHAAVSAMKHGAADFIEITAPRSLSRVLTAIDAALSQSAPNSGQRRRIAQPIARELTADSPGMRLLKTTVAGAARRNSQIAVVYGERGSGRNQVASYLHERREMSGSLFEIDADLWCGSVADLFGEENRRPGLLSSGATVFIDHVEFAPEEFISDIEHRLRTQGTRNRCSAPAMLLLGTASRDLADACLRLFSDCASLEVPPLRERAEDLFPIIRSCMDQLPATARINEPDWSAPLITILLQLSWPGNIRQFKASIINAVSTEAKRLDEHEKLPQLPTDLHTAELSRQQLGFLHSVLEEKERWERHAASYNRVPSLLEALRVLDSAQGNRRLAAALLGTSVSTLHQVLNQRNDSGAKQ